MESNAPRVHYQYRGRGGRQEIDPCVIDSLLWSDMEKKKAIPSKWVSALLQLDMEKQKIHQRDIVAE